MFRSLLIAAAVLAGAPALASQETVPTKRVSYADLNLASLDGRAELRARIEVAVDEVCDGRNVAPNYSAVVTECREHALRSAKLQIRDAMAIRVADARAASVVLASR